MTKESENTRISRVWITGKNSFTMTIPKDFAKQLGIDNSSHVIIEKISTGILVKKLEFRS